MYPIALDQGIKQVLGTGSSNVYGIEEVCNSAWHDAFCATSVLSQNAQIIWSKNTVKRLCMLFCFHLFLQVRIHGSETVSLLDSVGLKKINFGWIILI